MAAFKIVRLKFLVAVIAFSCVSSSEIKSGCPPNWIRNATSCYFLVSQRLSWNYANNRCGDRGGALVVVDSGQENTLIATMLSADRSSPYFWLGCTYVTTETEWVCGEGSVTKPMMFFNWEPGQPNDRRHNKTCAVFSTGSNQWHDAPCDRSYPAVCERDAKTTITNRGVNIKKTSGSRCVKLGSDGRLTQYA